ncbi:MAG: cytochrome c biogenesis protein [Acidobacteria bacterium]|nr:cytochrome c biogenesis protein [Acidobacteriota bacterium]MDW7984377.1 cytochrome c biogenesis protein CcsA [Acidobacteriota bacterium]
MKQRWPEVLWALSGPAGVIFWWMAFFYAPPEREMGDVQRVFYMHLPMAWTSMGAYGVSAVWHGLYLWKRQVRWLFHGWACVWVGVVTNVLVLATGMCWARPIWGSWWPWEPRLTTTFLMFIMYAAYLVLFAVLLPEGRTLGIVAYNLLSAVNLPVVYLAPRLWRGLHPVVIEGGQVRLDPAMWHTVLVGWLWSLSLALLFGFVADRVQWARFRWTHWLWSRGMSDA